VVPAPTVLIVDDDADTRVSTAEVLQLEGFTCWVEPSADAALARLRAEARTPDVILLDVVMPGMRPAAFVATLKNTPEFSRIPVIVLSGLHVSRRKAEVLCADLVLMKPCAVDVLLTAIRSVLERPDRVG
jgi:CheY-like chemotaxis protein